jgi:hypothetical protein
VWCIAANGAASVAINKGGNPPTFQSIGQVMSDKSGTYPTDMVLLGDIDGDGRVDYCLVDAGGNVRCWRNGGQGDNVAFWQGFAEEDGFGGIVFPTKNMGNRTRVRLRMCFSLSIAFSALNLRLTRTQMISMETFALTGCGLAIKAK